MIVGIAIFLIGLGMFLSDPQPRGFWSRCLKLALITMFALVCGWISVILFPSLP